MQTLGRLITSSIGQKVIMALSGMGLVIWGFMDWSFSSPGTLRVHAKP